MAMVSSREGVPAERKTLTFRIHLHCRDLFAMGWVEGIEMSDGIDDTDTVEKRVTSTSNSNNTCDSHSVSEVGPEPKRRPPSSPRVFVPIGCGCCRSPKVQ